MCFIPYMAYCKVSVIQICSGITNGRVLDDSPFRNPTKLGEERLRLQIQEPYQINVYIAGKMLSIMQRPVDWREIFMKQSAGKCKQINF